MNNNEWFLIKDLESFVNHSRKLVFSIYGNKEDDTKEIDIFLELCIEDKEELDNVLSFDESLRIVKSFAKQRRNKKTKIIKYAVNDDIYFEILKSLNDRMTSNILNSLVNKGAIETAYDSELDDFIFWVKEENK